jgi:hypothetical protein
MTVDDFKSSLKKDTPPEGVSPLLVALWYDGRNDWNGSHDIAQDIHTKEGSWLHAYLHRKEGDAGNASYWYHKAGKPVPTISLQKEWESLVIAFMP